MKRRIITRFLISILIAVPFFFTSRYAKNFQSIVSVMFTAASAFFPILIASVLSFDLSSIKNQQIATPIRKHLWEHKVGSLIQYSFAAIIFLLSAFTLPDISSKVVLCLALGATIVSIAYNIKIGIFDLPFLKEQVVVRIKTETFNDNNPYKHIG